MASEDDAGAVARVYRPYVEATVISFELDPPDEDEMRARIRLTLASHPWLVYERGGEVLGYAYASPHRTRAAYRWSVDTAVYLPSAHHRCGIGRGLYLSLFAILAAQGYVNAYAGITLPNAASVGLHESLGFSPVGIYASVGYKMGAWHDVGWWHLALRPPEPDPALPTGLATMETRHDWQSLLTLGLGAIRAPGPTERLGGIDG
jgi:phosphinothricin acetyltransferase